MKDMLTFCVRIGKRSAPLMLAFMMLSGAAAAAQGEQARCPPYGAAIKLDFVTKSPRPVYNHRLNIAGIANVLRTTGQAPPPHQTALGVTLTRTMFALQGASSSIKRDGGYCVYLTSVDVEFGWERVEVYLPSEFPEGTCEYRTILDHENQHVAINRAVLREFAPLIRARIETLLRAHQPIFTRSPEGSADAAIQGLHRHLSGMLDEFETAQSARNAGIDSASNYKALSTMCNDWDRGNVWPRLDGGR